MENTKHYLSRYPALLCEMEQTERELAHAPEALRTPLKRRLKTLRGEAVEIRRTVEQVPQDSLRMILKCRYLEGMTFEQVAEALYISERHVYRLHKAALREAAKVSRRSLPGMECHA